MFFSDVVHEFNDDSLAVDVGVEIEDVHFECLFLAVMESGPMPDVHHTIEEFVAQAYLYCVNTCVGNEFSLAVGVNVGCGIPDDSSVVETIDHLSADGVVSSKYKIGFIDVSINQRLAYYR